MIRTLQLTPAVLAYAVRALDTTVPNERSTHEHLPANPEKREPIMQPKRDRQRAIAKQNERRASRGKPTPMTTVNRMRIDLIDPRQIGIRTMPVVIGQLVVMVPLDLNVNDPGTALTATIVLALAGIGSQLADLQTVIASMPGYGRPVEGGASLFVATDAVRDALVRIHDLADARADALAAAAEAGHEPPGETAAD